MTTRLSINMNDATADAIRVSQARRQTSATDVIRRAVSVYKFFSDAQKRGDRIELVDGHSVTRVTFI